MTNALSDDAASRPADPWRRLLHRWFIEYNPCYLLSAALVLAGMTLLSRGLAGDASLHGRFGVTAVAELYSAALIGGAALLMRIRQRRSAVMLATLAIVYQGDLTLHTDTSPGLGAAGAVAAGAWFVLFVAKLSALAWAMRIRLSRAAVAAAALGALGLSALPFCLEALGRRGAGAVVMLWLFALVALRGSAVITSAEALDAWGRTVLRRAVRVAWCLLGALAVFHVVFWSVQGRLDLMTVVPVGALVAAHRARTERQAWAAVLATLAFVGWTMPSSLSAASLVAAAVCAVRGAGALRRWADDARSPVAEGPYRASGEDGETASNDPGGEGASRWLLGAAMLAHLSIWTMGWTGGAWPAHVVSLDLLLTAGLGAGGWLFRTRAVMVPAATLWGHLIWQAGLVPRPHSTQAWGGTIVALGFALLGASLATSYWLRPRLAAPSPSRSSLGPLDPRNVRASKKNQQLASGPGRAGR
ncbi:MAG TPA: hypothetical protein VFS43_47515 [Polyangiaceae bacterium]|nr:hypothetical protein [Polyangiaceae bacterium]